MLILPTFNASLLVFSHIFDPAELSLMQYWKQSHPGCLTVVASVKDLGLKNTVLWVVKSCISEGVRCFRTQLASCFCWFLAWLTRRPWGWGRYIPPKRLALSELRGVTTRGTALFIVTAVRIPNLTCVGWELLVDHGYIHPWCTNNIYTMGSQKVPGIPLQTENER
jgi:hypothetical protein